MSRCFYQTSDSYFSYHTYEFFWCRVVCEKKGLSWLTLSDLLSAFLCRHISALFDINSQAPSRITLIALKKKKIPQIPLVNDLPRKCVCWVGGGGRT